MVKELGASDSSNRTPDQSQIAFFWEDGPWGVTPPGHFLIIAMQLYQHSRMSLVDQARAMALTSMAMADAAIATWNSKFTYDIIRPETAIRYRAAKISQFRPARRCAQGLEITYSDPTFPDLHIGPFGLWLVGRARDCPYSGAR